MSDPGGASALRGRDIVLVASAPWESNGLLNCHHIALRLAAAGNRVLYVESPGLRTPNLSARGDRTRVVARLVQRARERRRGPAPLAAGLWRTSPLIVPLHGWPTIERWNRRSFARAVRAAARRLGFQRPILWSFLPLGIWLAGTLDEALLVYHCVDDYAANPGVDAGSVRRQEEALARSAQVVIATSRPLAERLAAWHGAVACLSNVAEVERFAAPADPEPGALAHVPHPRLGYLGNLADYKVDLALLADLARTHPAWQLVLVGPEGAGDPATDTGALRALPNVHLMGPCTPAEAPRWVHAFDVGLIPLRRGGAGESSLPLKTFEYLAAGLPVVSTPVAALSAEPDLVGVTFADDAPGFARAIEASLAENTVAEATPLRAARRACAARHSWTVRFPQLVARVRAHDPLA